MIRNEGELRKKIIEIVAFQTPWARKIAMYGGQRLGLAERLGVAESVIEDAVAMVRAGFVPRNDGKKVVKSFEVQVPDTYFGELRAFAKQAGMQTGPYLRSVLHAAMQTTQEPSLRPVRSWKKTNKPANVRPAKNRTTVNGLAIHRTHLSLQLSMGLIEAINRRASAYGLAPSQYAIMWFADLCEWKLRDLQVNPVSTSQMFDDSRAYVLPHIEDDCDDVMMLQPKIKKA